MTSTATNTHPQALEYSLYNNLSAEHLPQLGQTRCYWALLSPDLNFMFLEPVLAYHMEDQADNLLGQSLLRFVHEDDLEIARADITRNLARSYGGSTRVRYSRLSRVRRLLGHPSSEVPWQDAERIAVDANYMVVDIIVNYAAENLILCFLHAFVDLSPRDNNEVSKSDWTNWCGTPEIAPQTFTEMYHCLAERIPRSNPTQPLNCVFQICSNGPKHPLFISWPPDPPPAVHSLTSHDFASLAGGVVSGDPLVEIEAKTSCTRRRKSVQTMGMYVVESVFIPHGSVIFACHRVNGPSSSLANTSSLLGASSPRPTTRDSSQTASAPIPSNSSSFQPPPSSSNPTDSYHPPPTSTTHLNMGYESASGTAALPPPSSNTSYSPAFYDQAGHHASHNYSLPPISTTSLPSIHSQTHYQYHPQNHHPAHYPRGGYDYSGSSQHWAQGLTPHSASPSSSRPYWQAHDGSPTYMDNQDQSYYTTSNSQLGGAGPRQTDGGVDQEINSLVPPPRRRVSPQNDPYDQSSVPTSKSSKGPGNRPVGVLKCSSCKATSSPEWRKGPSGKKELCNACGLRYARSRAKKEGHVSQSSSGNRKKKTTASSLKSRSLSATPSPTSATSSFNGSGSYPPSFAYSPSSGPGTPPPSNGLPPLQQALAPLALRRSYGPSDHGGSSPSPPASAAAGVYGYHKSGQSYATSVPSPLGTSAPQSAHPFSHSAQNQSPNHRGYPSEHSPLSSAASGGLGESYERGTTEPKGHGRQRSLSAERDNDKGYEYPDRGDASKYGTITRRPVVAE